MTDHCGPKGKGWFARLLSWLIPDRIYVPFVGWVYLGDCCQQHDRRYKHGDRRKAADKELRRCIACKFRAAANRTQSRIARSIALFWGWVTKWRFYIGVRLGGWLCKD